MSASTTKKKRERRPVGSGVIVQVHRGVSASGFAVAVKIVHPPVRTARRFFPQQENTLSKSSSEEGDNRRPSSPLREAAPSDFSTSAPRFLPRTHREKDCFWQHTIVYREKNTCAGPSWICGCCALWLCAPSGSRRPWRPTSSDRPRFGIPLNFESD